MVVAALSKCQHGGGCCGLVAAMVVHVAVVIVWLLSGDCMVVSVERQCTTGGIWLQCGNGNECVWETTAVQAGTGNLRYKGLPGHLLLSTVIGQWLAVQAGTGNLGYKGLPRRLIQA